MLQIDKLAHTCLGALVAGGTLVVLGGGWAIGAIAIAVIGKEALNYYRHGRPGPRDALAKLAGGGVVLGAAWLPFGAG